MLATWLWLAALGAPQDEAAFVAGLAEARAALEKRDWKKAEAGARALLDAHERAPYVWLHLPEIVDLVETAGFWKGYAEPDPRTLISGELLSYSKSGANLRVRYTPKTLDDFVRVEESGEPEVRTHPVVFAGAYALEIRGPAYPRGALDAARPTLLFCLEEREGFASDFGFSEFASGADRYWAPAQFRFLRAGEWVDDDSQRVEPCNAGAPFDLEVKVTDTRVSVTRGGKPLFSAKKNSDVFGQVGFAGFPQFAELVVSGRAQPGWIQGKLDEHLQRAWEKHAQAMRAKSPLPDWLALGSAGDAGVLRVELGDVPMPVADETATRLARLLDTKPGQIRKAFDELARLDAAAVPDDLRTWIHALLHYRGRHLAQSLAECEKVVAAYPEFTDARRLHARLLMRVGKLEAAVAAGRELVRRAPDDDRAAADLAEVEFAAGDFAALGALLRERAERGRFTRELDAVNSLATRAKNGPGWTKAFEVKSEHYVVASDLDRKTCVEASELLESSLLRFEARLGARPREKVAPFRVYVFSGFAGYSRYVRDALDGSAENTAGMYHLGLKQLVIWNLPDREQMLRTVRHEGLHQFMDRAYGELPRWLHEGLAELYENAEFTRGPSRELVTHPQHLYTLRSGGRKLVPLATFVRQAPEDFMADAELHYAEAWALVHWLMTGPPERKRVVDALLAGSRTGASWEESVETAFADADFALLDRGLAAHVDSLEP